MPLSRLVHVATAFGANGNTSQRCLSGTPSEGVQQPLHQQSAGLSAVEMNKWREEGVLVIKGCASQEQVHRVKVWILQRLGLSPGEPEGWYDNPTGKPIQYNLTVPAGGGGRGADAQAPQLPPSDGDANSNAVAAWEIAQNPRTHAAFASLWGTHNLWASVGSAIFKPPFRPSLPRTSHICHEGTKKFFSLGDALPMHFDYPMDLFVQPETAQKAADPTDLCYDMQSALLLNDMDKSSGGTCLNVGYMHSHADFVTSEDGKREITRMRQEGRQHPDMSRVPGRRVNITGRAGDLLVW